MVSRLRAKRISLLGRKWPSDKWRQKITLELNRNAQEQGKKKKIEIKKSETTKIQV